MLSLAKTKMKKQLISVFSATILLGFVANLQPNSYFSIFASAQAQTDQGTPHLNPNWLIEKGVIQVNSGQLEDALVTFQQALAVSRADRNNQETALTNIGFVYHKLGQEQRALAYYQQAYELFQNPDLLITIGSTYQQLKERMKSLAYYRKALVIFRQSGNTERETATLITIGDLYFQLGEQERTLQVYQEVLEIYQRKQNCQGEDAILWKMARVYQTMGQDNIAEGLQRRVMRQMRDKNRRCEV